MNFITNSIYQIVKCAFERIKNSDDFVKLNFFFQKMDLMDMKFSQSIFCSCRFYGTKLSFILQNRLLPPCCSAYVSKCCIVPGQKYSMTTTTYMFFLEPTLPYDVSYKVGR